MRPMQACWRRASSATHDPAMLQRMLDYQQGMKNTVLQKATRLEQEGWESYML